MIGEDLVFIGAPDIAGQVRGKAFPRADLEKRRHRGIGWTPTNVQITAFDVIAETPFGSLGDLLMVADPATEIAVDYADGLPPEQFSLGDVLYTDGRPWELCLRSLLRSALARLQARTGCRLLCAFETEFQFRDSRRPGSSYSLQGFRDRRGFAGTLTAALRAAGLVPDTFMKEYGPDQYEITVAPAVGVAAADQATILREVVRATALRLESPVTFTPLRSPTGVGNGIHIHMSFLDEADRPASYDPNGAAEMSRDMAAFVGGILKYLPGFLALTAPSIVSYGRLTPHRWSAAFNNLGYRDREAAVRICPVAEVGQEEAARQFNVEFRASDATASPHLQLAALVLAGLQGLEEGLATPVPTEEDLSLLDPAALAARGLVRLPTSLEEALDRLEADQTVRNWFPPLFLEVYLKHKRGELKVHEGLTPAEVCARYEAVY